MDKQELINKIQHESNLWKEFLDEVGEERMEQPGASGEWNFKDVVAHLSTWRERGLTRLEAAVRDQAPSSFWSVGWDGGNDDELEETNSWIYEKNRNRPLSDVLEESRQQFRRMEELVRTLPESKLFDANRFDWMKGKPLANLINFGHFHEKHEPTLRRWLA